MVKNKHKTVCKEMLVDEFKVIRKSMKRKLYTTKRATKKPSRKEIQKLQKVDVELPNNDKPVNLLNYQKLLQMKAKAK